MAERRLWQFFILIWIVRVHKRQISGQRYPSGAFRERLFVAVEALEAILVIAIHGRVLLVAEGDGLREHAFSIGCVSVSVVGDGEGGGAVAVDGLTLLAVRTNGPFLVTFQFPRSTGQAAM